MGLRYAGPWDRSRAPAYTDPVDSPQDQVHIVLRVSDGNSTEESARLVETAGSAPSADAGFRPGTGWVKLGYFPNLVSSSTERYRDYNNDGVRDIVGNPYAIPSPVNPPAAGQQAPNKRTGRGPAYADYAITLE